MSSSTVAQNTVIKFKREMDQLYTDFLTELQDNKNAFIFFEHISKMVQIYLTMLD